jgi:hypothetical protein
MEGTDKFLLDLSRLSFCELEVTWRLDHPLRDIERTADAFRLVILFRGAKIVLKRFFKIDRACAPA